jgi:Ca2+-binding EF-hand superfamily protein
MKENRMGIDTRFEGIWIKEGRRIASLSREADSLMLTWKEPHSFETRFECVINKNGQCEVSQGEIKYYTGTLVSASNRTFRIEWSAKNDTYWHDGDIWEKLETVNMEGLENLLVERGNMDQSPGGRELICEIVDNCSFHKPFDFRTVVNIAIRARQRGMAQIDEAARMYFNYADKDGSGELDMCEVSNCLVQLNMWPSSPKQQLEIARIMEEVDADGSGDFDFDEMLQMIQRIRERMMMIDRAEEAAYGRTLGYTSEDTGRLRFVFSQLDDDQSGTLEFPEIRRALAVLRGDGTIADNMLSDIREDLQRRGLMPLHFYGFIDLTKAIDEEFAAAEWRAKESRNARRKMNQFESPDEHQLDEHDADDNKGEDSPQRNSVVKSKKHEEFGTRRYTRKLGK